VCVKELATEAVTAVAVVRLMAILILKMEFKSCRFISKERQINGFGMKIVL